MHLVAVYLPLAAVVLWRVRKANAEIARHGAEAAPESYRQRAGFTFALAVIVELALATALDLSTDVAILVVLATAAVYFAAARRIVRRLDA
jgi:hypothetical protein